MSIFRRRRALAGAVSVVLFTLLIVAVIYYQRQSGKDLPFLTLSQSNFIQIIRNNPGGSRNSELLIVQNQQDIANLERSPQFNDNDSFSLNNEPVFTQV